MVPIFPIHPFTLAKHAITAQIASEGRLTLGVGLSHRPMIEDVMGLLYDEPARHMEEYLSVLRPLLDEGKVYFAGRFYKVKGQYQVPGALHVPVVVAALAPMMLRVAGEQADGTFTWMAGPKTVESHVVPRITRAAESVGRSAPRVCVGMPLAVTDDPQRASAQAAKTYTAGMGRRLLLREHRTTSGVLDGGCRDYGTIRCLWVTVASVPTTEQALAKFSW